MTISTLVASAKKIPHFLQYGMRLNPSRDWLVALAVFFILFIGSIIWNTMFFFNVVSGVTQDSSQTTDTAITESTVSAVEKVFVERSRELERFTEQRIFVDPSH